MGEVMQFLYGEDGMEGTAIEGQRMEFLRFNRRKFRDVSAGGGGGRRDGAGQRGWPALLLRRRTSHRLAPPASHTPPQAYRYDLDQPNWAPDWLEPAVLDRLRTDLESRQAIEAEYQVRGAVWGGGCGGGVVDCRVRARRRCPLSALTVHPGIQTSPHALPRPAPPRPCSNWRRTSG